VRRPYQVVIISTFISAAKSLQNLVRGDPSDKMKKSTQFIKFCENVNAIIKEAADELKKEPPANLGAIGAQLGAWARPGKFEDPSLKQQHEDLVDSVKSISKEM